MSQVLFRGMRLLDPRWDEPRDGYEVLIDGSEIKEVADTPIRSRSAEILDCGGRTLMPGLIDCHAHVFLSEVSLRALESVPLTLMTARAAVLARAMLDRGFTTVRDAGGADWGMKQAIEDGLLAGPRLFISGQPISGVRTIEHGNFIDDATATLIATKKRFLVANLVTYVAMKERGAALGMTAEMLAKNDRVLEAGLRSLEICKRAGVSVGYGSDLLGSLQQEQSREFVVRSEVLSPIEIIRQATLVGAEIVREENRLGVFEPGARADVLVVDGDPVRDLALLLDQGAHLSVIMQRGRFHKNLLS